jgi:inosine-uridine nucleoside N-ribohydrolase
MHDPLATTAAFNLDFIDTISVTVGIETKGEYTVGLTVVNRYENEEWNKIRVATAMSSDEFRDFMPTRILS